MIKKKSFTDREAELRWRAEEMARENTTQSAEDLEAQSPEETRQTLHELRVHQIELEIQNYELRRAQVELDAVRAHYSDLYDLAPVGYCTLSEKGLILEANLTAAMLLGVTRGKLVKQPISRFILKEDQNVYYLLRKQLFETGEPQACELRMVKSEGAPFWTRLEATAVQDAEGAPVGRVVMSDITERKQAAEALRESEERYKNFVEKSFAGVYVVQSGLFKFLNDNAASFSGYKPEELIGRQSDSLAYHEDLGKIREKSKKMLRGEDSSPYEFRIVTKDGQIRWIMETVTSIQYNGRRAILGNSMDITERKQAEEVLRESEDKLAKSYESLTSILDSLDSLVYVADFNSYEILFINKYGRDIFGDVQGRKCWQAIQKDQKGPCSFCTNDRLLSDSGLPTGVYQWEFQNTANGSWYDCQDQAISWIGKTLVRMEIATDITKSKQAEEARYQYERLQGVLEMAGAICHEMNQPMQIISGCSEMLLMNIPENDPIHTKLDTIITQIHRMGTITRKLMTIEDYETQDYAGFSRIIDIDKSAGKDTE